MPELPKVSQEFDADTGPFVASIQNAIDQLKAFSSQIDDTIAKVQELNKALKDLPKVVTVNVKVNGMDKAIRNVEALKAGLDSLQDKTITTVVRTVYENVGTPLRNSATTSVNKQINIPVGNSNASNANNAGTTIAQIIQTGQSLAGGNGQTGSMPADLAALSMAITGMGGALTRVQGEADGANAAINSMSNTSRNLYGWWRLLGKEVPLWAGVFGDNHLIGQTQLWHIALDGLIEVTVAATEAVIGLGIAFAAMAPGALLIYEHLRAVSIVSDALNTTIPPLGGAFKQLAISMEPQVIELYGGALNLMTGNGTVLNRVVHELVTGFDDWVAKLDEWNSAQSHSGQILTGSVEVLHQFEQILDNVGVAFDNFLKADPGTVHFLLDFAVGVTKVLDVLTSLPSGVLKAALALHAIDLWGGLAATGIVKLLGPLARLSGSIGGIEAADTAVAGLGANATGMEKLKAVLSDIGAGFVALGGKITEWVSGIGVAMAEADGVVAAGAAGMRAAFGGVAETLAMVASSPLTWFIAAAGAVAYLGIQAVQASASVKKFITDTNAGISQMSAKNAFQGITDAMVAVQAKMGQVNKEWADSKPGIQALTGTWSNFFSSWEHGFDNMLGKSDPSLNALQAEMSKLAGEEKNLFSAASETMKQNGLTFSQATEIMTAAGVQAGDSLQTMMTKINNLITGYKAMSVQGPALARSVDAVTLAADLQNSKVGQLNSAWDQFEANATGGTSSMASLTNELSTIGNVTTNATSKISAFGQQAQGMSLTTKQVAEALKGFGGTSAQVWANYDTALQQGEQVTDWWRTSAAEGATTGKQLDTAIATVAAQFLPYAANSKVATAELSTLVQQAGGPATSNFATLKKWIDDNSESQSKYNTQLGATTIKMSDVSAAAQGMSGSLNQLVSQALAAGQVNIAQMTKDATQLNNVLRQNPGDVSAVNRVLSDLIPLLSQSGQNATSAGSEIYQMALNDNLSTDAAKKLASQVTNAMNSIAQMGDTTAGQQANRQTLLTDTLQILSKTPTATKDINDLAKAVEKHGSTAASYQGARQQLIRDLRDSGVKANTARGMVDGLISALKKIPANENTRFTMVGSGTYSINTSVVSGSRSKSGAFEPGAAATGGYIKAGTTSKADDVPIWASRGEFIVQADAVQKYGKGFMDAINQGRFASGGIVEQGNQEVLGGDYFTRTVSPAFVKAMANTMAGDMRNSEKQAIAAAQAAASAAAAANAGFVHPTGSGASVEALMESMAASIGWTGEMLTDLLAVENREAGFNLSAQNPSSGAYGLAQFINGPSEYAQYGGNVNTAAGQITAMFNYIRQRYGNPHNAEMHEVSYGWYDQGGMLNPGYTMAYNGTGQPERVTSPSGSTGSSGDLHVHLNVDGKEFATAVYSGLQQTTYQKNVRNNGIGGITGSVRPGK